MGGPSRSDSAPGPGCLVSADRVIEAVAKYSTAQDVETGEPDLWKSGDFLSEYERSLSVGDSGAICI